MGARFGNDAKFYDHGRVSVADVRRYAGELASKDAALALYGPVQAAPTLEDIRKRLAA